MTNAMDKTQIRLKMRPQRAALDTGWVLLTSRRIADRMVALPEFQRAEVVCCYLALTGETQTQLIMEAAWKAGKRVAVPALRDDGEYMPVWITPDEPLSAARFSVRQPTTPHWAKPDRFDLIVVPGVAFSAEGGRMGHGRGFYDRMLARLGARVGCKAGICFNSQMVPGLPMAEHDVRMDVVVTEEAVYRAT